MSKPIPGEGPSQADLVIVGEAAGADEEVAGRPFVGAAGKLLDSLLADAGIKRSDCYITNLVKEHPAGNNIRPWFSGGRFSDTGLTALRFLHEEVADRGPRIVVTLGAVAWHAMSGDFRPITKVRGCPFQLNEATLLPTLHPAHILRGAWMDRYLVATDLKRARRLLDDPTLLCPRNLRLDPTCRDALNWLQDAADLTEIGFDIEIAGNEMTCFSIAHTPWDAMSIPMGRWAVGEKQDILDALAELLGAATGPAIVTQNGNFDTSFLEEFYGIRTRLSRVEDTMCAHHVMRADLGGDEKVQNDGTVRVKRSSKSLALLASLYTFEPYYKDEGGRARADGDLEAYLAYNAKDAAVTLECWQVLHAELSTLPAMWRTYRNLTMARLPAVQAMQKSGLRVDLKRYTALRIEAENTLKRINGELQEELWAYLLSRRKPLAAMFSEQSDAVESAERDLSALKSSGASEESTTQQRARISAEKKKLTTIRTAFRVALKPFNPDSPEQCCDLFYRFYGLPERTARRRGKGGKPDERTVTVDDEALTEFARPTSTRKGIRAAALIKAIREQGQQIETFLNWELWQTDRFRAAFNLRGTKFGRMSSSKLFFRYGGNQQNIPESVRTCILADREAA